MKKIEAMMEEILEVVSPDDLVDKNHRITDSVTFPDLRVAICVYCIEKQFLFGASSWEEWVVSAKLKGRRYTFKERYAARGMNDPSPTSRTTSHYRFLLKKTGKKEFEVCHMEYRGRVEWRYKYAISKNGSLINRGQERFK